MRLVYLFRHAATASNAARLFLGRRDEPLSPAGVAQARARFASGVPEVDAVFCSPLSRCVETARILYPSFVPTVVDEFIEMDFGRFEGKDHAQLMASEPEYQRWLDSGGTSPVPDGECMADLTVRCCAGFRHLASSCEAERAAVVVHGGTIMALLAALCDPPRGFYDSYTQNCCDVPCSWDGSHLRVLEGGV